MDGVSGAVKPGNFVSIIGASGAGKTTLLNHLSGRLAPRNLKIRGDIRVNGVDKNKVSTYSQFSAYVQQDDVLYQTMTVRECIMFAAQLRMIGTPEQKLAKVNKLIEDLKLTKC